VRDFLYLDPALVAQTLAQLEFGLFKDWQETIETTSAKEGGLGLTLWGAANVGGKGQRSDKSASQVAFEQTAESYASRLLVKLEEGNQLVRLGQDTPTALRRGTVIAVETDMESLDLFHETPAELFEGEWPTMQLVLHDLDNEAVGSVSVFRVGSFAVVATWPPENLRSSLDEVDGEAEVVGIIRRMFLRDVGEIRVVAVLRPIALY
jgi:hypothetical protein